LINFVLIADKLAAAKKAANQEMNKPVLKPTTPQPL
jgi:hypothetical protein